MTAWLDDGDVRIHHGDALEHLALMPSESVHCIVTSPPFWGLRDYGVDGQIGLEETPDEWCARLVAVMREARRVLRSDGVAWVEVGDTYNANQGSGFKINAYNHGEHAKDSAAIAGTPARTVEGIKQKDLVGAPWLLAFALRADGWYLRSDTIWARPNPMPESVTDRPTKAHSYVFLLTKSARYYYDADAIREEAQYGRREQAAYEDQKSDKGIRRRVAGAVGGNGDDPSAGRNARSVWSIPTEPTPFAHFATFPQALVERCIKAGTSEHGACSACGAPWRRVTERGPNIHPGSSHIHAADLAQGGTQTHESGKPAGTIMAQRFHASTPPVTVGWEPSCACMKALAEWIVKPCVVLDPFMGSGTTALVARRLSRHAIGIELNAEYLAIAERRLQQLSLLA